MHTFHDSSKKKFEEITALDYLKDDCSTEQHALTVFERVPLPTAPPFYPVKHFTALAKKQFRTSFFKFPKIFQFEQAHCSGIQSSAGPSQKQM